MRLAPLLLAAFALAACGTVDTRLADGGRARYHCTNSPNTWPVKVLDRSGAPAPDVSVTAMNLADNANQVAGLTDGRGVYSVSESVGPGTVRVTAELNGLKAGEGAFNFTCGDCDCACNPRELILRLQ